MYDPEVWENDHYNAGSIWLGCRSRADVRAWHDARYYKRSDTLSGTRYWAGPWEMSDVDVIAAEARRLYKWITIQDPDPFRTMPLNWAPILWASYPGGKNPRPSAEGWAVLAADQYNAGIVMGFQGYTGRARRDRFAWHDARYRGRMAAYWAGPWPCGVPEACPTCRRPANRCYVARFGFVYRCIVGVCTMKP